MKRVVFMLVAVPMACVFLGVCRANAAVTEYTWDGVSTAYGDQVTVAYDDEGKVATLTTTVAKGDKVVFVGDPATFATNAVVTAQSIGTVIFSNEVVTAGDVTLQGLSENLLADTGDSSFIMGKCVTFPVLFADFSELKVTSAEMHYLSGKADVRLDLALYHERRSADWYEIQGQDYNGAWTRCAKIGLMPTEEGGLAVTNVYCRQTSQSGVKHLGEDFDNATFPYVNSTMLWLRNVRVSIVHNPEFRRVTLANKLTAAGKLKVSQGARLTASGAAIGAKDGATCGLDINFDDGVFEFLDSGHFTHTGRVTGEKGQLIYASSDAEPQTSELRFEPNLTSADQTVLSGVSLASITGMTAVVRWYRYDGVSKGEDVMYDEYRGDLRAAFFRNIGNETVVRFQASSKTWGSLLNSAWIRLKQDGTNVVAKTIGTSEQWMTNIPSKTRDPWVWDAFNDGGRPKGPEYILALSNLVFKLARPLEAPTWDTQVTLACTDSTKQVSYVFKPGANRHLTAIVTSDAGMPQTSGEVHVYDRARVVLSGQDFSKIDYGPTYQGLWQGQSSAANIFVHEGGRMLTNQRAQNSGYGQTISIDGGKYAFRDASEYNEYALYKFRLGYFFVDCVANMEYKNGAVSEGDGPYLGKMGSSSRISVRGTKPCVCRNGYGLYSNGNSSTSQPTCTLDIDDVTGDDAVDFTMEQGFWWENYRNSRLAKTGPGTALLLKKSDLPNAPFRILQGTLLMGMSTGLGTKGVSLEGGTLAIQAGLTNSVNGTLALTANSGIKLTDGSQIVIADSSAVTWTNGVRLVITGDPEKSSITFGANGLTAAQLKQIRWNGRRVEMNADGTLKQYIPGALIVVK